ncbi:MAG: phage tail protein [Syntrophobacterales bacterium]|nr:phage tail protein [Syntrophobacterales bacterium]
MAHAFGLAVTGRPGQAYSFPASEHDDTHFRNMVQQFFTMSGDHKPNVLNADGIPFACVEDADIWDYAPNYIMAREMGSLEGVVLMLEVALDWARVSGNWGWYETLKGFILADHRTTLGPHQISRLTFSRSAAGVRNLIRLRFADFDRNPASYVEERDEAAIRAWGEQVLDVDCRYGSPVIVEDPDTARLIAQRLLKRLALPWEMVHLVTWLEGARLEVGDTVAITSDFHGFQGEEFTLFGKSVDLKRHRVELQLARPAKPGS